MVHRNGNGNGTRERRVLVHGHKFPSERFVELMDGDGWKFTYFPDRGLSNFAQMAAHLQRADLVYQIGGRVSIGPFLRAARLLGKKKIVMHWVGTDILICHKHIEEGRKNDWVLNNLQHWAVSEHITQETRDVGVPSEFVPLPSPRVPPVPSPMPKEFSVMVYMPDLAVAELYGLDQILEVSKAMPNVTFKLVGLREGTIEGAPPNLLIHGNIPDLKEFYLNTPVLWRPAAHDGLSFMVMEAMGYGRHVIWSYPFPGVIHAPKPPDAIREIARLQELSNAGRLEVNMEGVKAIPETGVGPQQMKVAILDRLTKLLDS